MIFDSLAMSGTPGSGKSTLSTSLKKQLGWKIFSIGDEYRNKHAEWQKETDRFDVDFNTYWRNEVTQEDIFRVNEEAREMLRHGKVILDSRYAPWNALGVDGALKVLVEAPLGVRAKRGLETGKYEGLDIEGIREHLWEREQGEVLRGRQSYDADFGGWFDYRNHTHYDLVLDSSKMNVDEEVSSVLKALG